MGTPCNYVEKVHHENANVEYKRPWQCTTKKNFDEKNKCGKKTP